MVAPTAAQDLANITFTIGEIEGGVSSATYISACPGKLPVFELVLWTP